MTLPHVTLPVPASPLDLGLTAPPHPFFFFFSLYSRDDVVAQAEFDIDSIVGYGADGINESVELLDTDGNSVGTVDISISFEEGDGTSLYLPLFYFACKQPHHHLISLQLSSLRPECFHSFPFCAVGMFDMFSSMLHQGE